MEVTSPPKDHLNMAVFPDAGGLVRFSASPIHPSRRFLMKLLFCRQFLWFWRPSELV